MQERPQSQTSAIARAAGGAHGCRRVTVASSRSLVFANGLTASPRSQTGSRWTKRGPFFFFAGICRPFVGERKGDVDEHLLFSFLTTVPKAVVAPIHAKAMPVILLDDAARETWLTGSLEAALALQRSSPDGALRIVASGDRIDPLKA